MILMIEMPQMSSFLTKSMDVKKELKMKKIKMFTGNFSRFLLIVFFIVPGVSLFSLDVSGTRWGSDGRLGYGIMSIEFGADQHFSIGSQETMAEGTYSQTENDITLDYTDIASVYQADIEKVGTKLSIVETDDVLCSYKLVGSGGIEFINSRDYKPSQGAKRKVDGIVVYVYDAEGTVNANARMREGPGSQYKNARDDYSGEEIVLPKGEAVTVYGRSENQTTINGVKAYWYYCAYYEYFVGRYGWIWGGAIDLEK
jgi:hypothetical protein